MVDSANMSAIIFHVNFCVFMALFMEFCYNRQARIEKENNNVNLDTERKING